MRHVIRSDATSEDASDPKGRSRADGQPPPAGSGLRVSRLMRVGSRDAA